MGENTEEQGEEKELGDFIAENSLPCYAYVRNSHRNHENKDQDDKFEEIVYLFKQFEASCFFAKRYSNMFETYLLHHRPSYDPSDNNFTISSNINANIKQMFNDIVSIPYNYQGLFEIFSSTSVKVGGILDHERDLVSFASRLKNPKNYYVAKEMRVFELKSDKETNCKNENLSWNPASTYLTNKDSNKNLCRKWTKIEQGSICKAVKVVVIDYDHDQESLIDRIKNTLCLKFKSTKKKTEYAIEFKVIENLEDLMENSENENHSESDKEDSNQFKNVITQPPDRNSISKSSLNEKSYYLPVYGSDLNIEIDLIPITTSLKQKSLKTNSLQIIRNLSYDNRLIDNDEIDLKLFDDGHFLNRPQAGLDHDMNRGNNFTNLLKDNQHLELNKYSSVYEIIDFKSTSKMIIGYSLTNNRLFVTAVDQLLKKSPNDENKKNLFSKLNENNLKTGTNNELYSKFQQKVDNFSKQAKYEIENFEESLNRIEIFSLGDENGQIKSESNYAGHLFKNLRSKPSIIHFSDLVDIDETEPVTFKNNQKHVESSENIQQVLAPFMRKLSLRNRNHLRKTIQSKFNTLPTKIFSIDIFKLNENINETVIDDKNDKNNNKIVDESFTKKNSRYKSLPFKKKSSSIDTNSNDAKK